MIIKKDKREIHYTFSSRASRRAIWLFTDGQSSSKVNEHCYCLLTDHERPLAIFEAWQFR